MGAVQFHWMAVMACRIGVVGHGPASAKSRRLLAASPLRRLTPNLQRNVSHQCAADRQGSWRIVKDCQGNWQQQF